MALLLAAVGAFGQNAFTAVHKYDGEHKNVAAGYVMGGHNVVSGAFGGLELSYTRHLTDRGHVGGDLQAQFGKQLYSIDFQGGIQIACGVERLLSRRQGDV